MRYIQTSIELTFSYQIVTILEYRRGSILFDTRLVCSKKFNYYFSIQNSLGEKSVGEQTSNHNSYVQWGFFELTKHAHLCIYMYIDYMVNYQRLKVMSNIFFSSIILYFLYFYILITMLFSISKIQNNRSVRVSPIRLGF